MLQIENSLGELKTEVTHRIESRNGILLVHESRKIKGIFMETLGKEFDSLPCQLINQLSIYCI